MGASVKFLTVFLLGFSTTGIAGESFEFYRSLAEYYAPAIIHQVGKSPRADIPTRYDYDGDFYADNNWKNLDAYELHPIVYYEVIESQTHYFITYGFYHARDYTNLWFCFTHLCHENDLEGTILTVRKDFGFGKLELIEALAHISISGVKQPYTYIGNSTHKTGLVKRAVLRIESGGHGVHTWNGDYPKKFKFYLPADDSSKPQIDIIPIYYELASMQELWNLRGAREIERIFVNTFDFLGGRFQIKNLPKSFAGKKFGLGLASLPWAWSELGTKRGAWFLDPAAWSKKVLKNPDNFSLEYVHHPYVDSDSIPAP